MDDLITINKNRGQAQKLRNNNSLTSINTEDTSIANLEVILANNTELKNRAVEMKNSYNQQMAGMKERYEREMEGMVTKKDSLIIYYKEKANKFEDRADKLKNAVIGLGNKGQILKQKNAELEEKKERLEKEILGLERKKAELEKENEKQKQKNKKLKQIFEKCNDYLFGVRTQRNVLLVAVVGIAFGYIFR